MLAAHHQRDAVAHWTEVRYERLRAAPRAELARVFRSLDLPVDDDVLEQVAREAGRRENVWGATKPRLRRRDRRTIRRVAGEALALLDTPTDVAAEPAPSPDAAGTTRIDSPHDSQHTVDQLLEVLHGARPAEHLPALLAADATFRLVAGDDEVVFRGPDAPGRWLAAVREDDSVTWPVEQSWAHPDLRLVTTVVTHRQHDTRCTRTHVVRLGPEGITQVTTHVGPREHLDRRTGRRRVTRPGRTRG